MSYILDALRRAERERSRGQLPDLLTAAPDEASSAPTPLPAWRQRRAGWVAAGVVGLALLGWAMAGWLSGPASTGTDRPAPRPMSVTMAPAESGMPAQVGDPQPSPTRPATTSPATSPVATSSGPSLAPPGTPAAANTAARPAAPPASQPPFLPPPPPRPAPRQEAPAVVPWSQLAADVRASLPKLNFGGAVHSPVAASRLVLVDGQVAREGATVAPGVVLERIGPNSVVLKRGDLRYEVPL